MLVTGLLLIFAQSEACLLHIDYQTIVMALPGSHQIALEDCSLIHPAAEAQEYCPPLSCITPCNSGSHLDLLAQGKAEAGLPLRMLGCDWNCPAQNGADLDKPLWEPGQTGSPPTLLTFPTQDFQEFQSLPKATLSQHEEGWDAVIWRIQND